MGPVTRWPLGTQTRAVLEAEEEEDVIQFIQLLAAGETPWGLGEAGKFTLTQREMDDRGRHRG